MLRDTHESRHLRMTYLKGSLEIMSTSRRHEVERAMIARLLELFCLERGIPLFAYGRTTWRKEEGERGLEADICYARDRDKENPDIAIEVIVTHGLLDKLEVYRGLGIREVWLFENGVFTIVTLRGELYEQIAASETFPEVDFAQLARFSRSERSDRRLSRPAQAHDSATDVAAPSAEEAVSYFVTAARWRSTY